MSNSFAQLQRHICFCNIMFLFTLGAIGNFLLIYILFQRCHRKNSYSLYSIAIAIVNILLIQCVLPFDLYSVKSANPSYSSLIWCKTQSYFYNSLSLLYSVYKMASCIDRATMCDRRASIRSFSQPKIARRVIFILTCVCLLLYIHSAIYFRINLNQCGPQPGIYTKFFNIYSTVINGWPLPIVVTICGIISYRNLKKIQNRSYSRVLVFNSGTGLAMRIHREHVGKRNRQSILLLLSDIILCIPINAAYAIYMMYVTITYAQIKSPDRQCIESFLAYFSSFLLVLMNNCTPFYLNLIISSKFRKEVAKLTKKWYQYYSQAQVQRNN